MDKWILFYATANRHPRAPAHGHPSKGADVKARIALARPMFAADLLSTGCGDEGGTKGSGAETFRRICSQCHGLTGNDMPHLGNHITTSACVASNTDQQFHDFVKRGPAPDHSDNTADGVIRPCLLSLEEWNILTVLRTHRAPEGDVEVSRFLTTAIRAKREGHEISSRSFIRPTRSMTAIGG